MIWFYHGVRGGPAHCLAARLARRPAG